MSKRFTDTEKWKDAWFLDLSPNAKVLFIFLCDSCDLAGFYERHDRSISYYTGIEQLDKVYKELEKSVLLVNGLIWVKNFIRHQKNLPLNPINNSHKSIIGLLLYREETFGTYYQDVLGLSLEELRGLQGACKGLISPIGKGKGKGKDISNKREIVKREISTSQEIYSYYSKTIKPGAKEDAIKSIDKLLKAGLTKDELISRINAYKQQLDKNPTDKQYYIQANNFFGLKARYKDFEPVKTKYKEADKNCKLCKGTGWAYIPNENANKKCDCTLIK